MVVLVDAQANANLSFMIRYCGVLIPDCVPCSFMRTSLIPFCFVLIIVVRLALRS